MSCNAIAIFHCFHRKGRSEWSGLFLFIKTNLRLLFLGHMNGFLVHIERCFHDAFCNRWMRVNGVGHFFKSCFHLNGKRCLVDEIGCMGPEYHNAQHFAVLLVGDDLHESAGLIDDKGLAAAHKREAADLHVAVLGFASFSLMPTLATSGLV